MTEIKRQADHALNNRAADVQILRKALVNIANLAVAELESGELKMSKGRH